jgi:hypothetical protein
MYPPLRKANLSCLHDYLLPPTITYCLLRLPIASYDYLLPPCLVITEPNDYTKMLVTFKKRHNKEKHLRSLGFRGGVSPPRTVTAPQNRPPKNEAIFSPKTCPNPPSHLFSMGDLTISRRHVSLAGMHLS